MIHSHGPPRRDHSQNDISMAMTVTSASKENIICVPFSSESPLLCIIQAVSCVSTNLDGRI